MNKFSNVERFHMYNAAIEILKNSDKRSICTSLRQIILVTDKESISVQNMEKHFPELKKRLPLKKEADNEHRIEILIECIKDISYGNKEI